MNNLKGKRKKSFEKEKRGGEILDRLLKNIFLYLSKNKKLNILAKKHGLKMGADKFVAGVTIKSSIEAVRKLNSKGVSATLDHLGEFVKDAKEAEKAKTKVIETINEIHKNQVDANISVKITQLGLDISAELCLNNMREILEAAKQYNIFVRIDMEDYSRNEKTIALFEELQKDYPNHVGLVIQAYLYKSLNDVKRLSEKETNLRICKGAYNESSQVAFPNKKDVDKNYIELVKKQLEDGHYVGIATHDEKIIDFLKGYINGKGIGKDRFEFQMLYGIKSKEQEKLAREGYKVRAYVPYGEDWYGYFMRRLAERPANVWFVLKSLFE